MTSVKKTQIVLVKVHDILSLVSSCMFLYYTGVEVTSKLYSSSFAMDLFRLTFLAIPFDGNDALIPLCKSLYNLGSDYNLWLHSYCLITEVL